MNYCQSINVVGAAARRRNRPWSCEEGATTCVEGEGERMSKRKEGKERASVCKWYRRRRRKSRREEESEGERTEDHSKGQRQCGPCVVF